jgi:hypothetical protein
VRMAGGGNYAWQMGRLFAPDGAAIRSHQDIAGTVEWLRRFLSARGVRLAASGYFRAAEGHVSTYLRWRSGEDVGLSMHRQIEMVRATHSFIRIARALRRAFDGRDAPGLDAKVRELADQPFGLQDARGSNHARDTMWELFVGAVFAQVDPGVRFESPDIRLRFRGHDWGIECKVLVSRRIDQHRQLLRKAAEQIEDSTADFGLVFANITNQLDHSTLFAPHEAGGVLTWESRAKAEAAMGDQIKALQASWDAAKFRERLGRGEGRRPLTKVRGAAMFGEAVVNTRGGLNDQTHTQFYGNRALLFDEEALVVAFAAAFNETT